MTYVAKALAIVGLIYSALGWNPSAQAADLSVGTYVYNGPCAERRFLNQIYSRFRYQVRHVPGLPDVSILEFRDIYERRYEGDSTDWPIPRLYCGATVVLSDGDIRDMWYLVEYGMGFAGVGNNVEFCVSGFDRWYVYNGRCRVLRE
jgi:capsid protein